MSNKSNNFEEFKNNLILIGVAAVAVGLAGFLTVAYTLTDSKENYDIRPSGRDINQNLPDTVNSKDTTEATNIFLLKP